MSISKTLSWSWASTSALALSLVVGPAVAAEDNAPAIEPQASKVLKDCGDYLHGLRSFSVKITTTVDTAGLGHSGTSANTAQLVLKRPNLMALRSEGVTKRGMVVCDGRKLYTCATVLNKYTEQDAPEKLDALAQDPGLSVVLSGPANMFVGPLLADNPYQQIMEGVTAVRYLGTEAIDGVECHHIRGTQPQLDWDVWVETGPKPLLRRAVPDLSKLFATPTESDDGKSVTAKPSFRIDLRDWQVNIDPPPEQFEFTPPKGVEKVDRLFGDGDGDDDEEPHPLLGKPAPAFKIKLLDGGQLDLAEHQGKHVVVLDFWATWCGPCVRGLPALAKIAKDYADKGVAVYAVNQGQDSATIKEFLKQRKLDLPVTLDSDEKVGELYEVEGIPQTVVIDKKGVVQVVHVGFGPETEKRLASDIDAVLAGRDLAAEAEQRAASRPAPGAEAEGMELAWSMRGRWSGVAADAVAGVVYATSRAGQVIKLDVAGKELARFRLELQGGMLRLANLQADAQRELLVYGRWGQTLLACDADGKKLWDYQDGQGIDDICAADLDADGLDEVVIGHNGFTGLHVFGPDGKLKWKDTKIGNVWHVCVGDVNGDGKPEVVSTSAAGQLHVYDAAGNKLKDIVTKSYANLVRLTRLRPDDQAMTIITDGTSLIWGNRLFAMSPGGEQKRLMGLGRGQILSAQAAGTKPWLAIAMMNGPVKVVDLVGARTLATAGLDGMCIEVDWLEPKDGPPLLLAANGRGIFAFRITGSRSPTTTRAGS